jgi:hypothetical protein
VVEEANVGGVGDACVVVAALDDVASAPDGGVGNLERDECGLNLVGAAGD